MMLSKGNALKLFELLSLSLNLLDFSNLKGGVKRLPVAKQRGMIQRNKYAAPRACRSDYDWAVWGAWLFFASDHEGQLY